MTLQSECEYSVFVCVCVCVKRSYSVQLCVYIVNTDLQKDFSFHFSVSRFGDVNFQCKVARIEEREVYTGFWW